MIACHLLPLGCLGRPVASLSRNAVAKITAGLPDQYFIYVDGSADIVDERPRSSWSLVVCAVISGCCVILGFLAAPCALGKAEKLYIGAERHSNNVGEASALFHAVRVRTHLLPAAALVTVCPDSKWALNIPLFITRVNANFQLAMHVRAACHGPRRFGCNM
jgi:hypothetical protein